MHQGIYNASKLVLVGSTLQTGKYDNVARLWVDDVPTVCASGEVKLERHDAVRVSLTHLSQPHKVRI